MSFDVEPASLRVFAIKLEQMLNHLLVLTDSSGRALRDVADGYERTDDDTASRIDATYPAAPRPSVNRD
jgi:hypothetical protein